MIFGMQATKMLSVAVAVLTLTTTFGTMRSCALKDSLRSEQAKVAKWERTYKALEKEIEIKDNLLRANKAMEAKLQLQLTKFETNLSQLKRKNADVSKYLNTAIPNSIIELHNKPPGKNKSYKSD